MSETPATRAYRVAYDGRPFHGFQRQPDVSTVADALLDALRDLGVAFDGDVPPGYAAAGRTDAGVSALAQTVAFEAPAWLSPAAFNSELPASVRAWAAADAPEGFHATHDAVERVQGGADDADIDDGEETINVETDASVQLGQQVTLRGHRQGDRLEADEIL